MDVFLQSVEADLRNLSTEARKSESLAGQLAGWLANSEHPEVKVAAERAILNLRALTRENLTKDSVRDSKEILRPFLLACETKNARLTVLSLTCIQKLIANDVVSEEGIVAIITTLQHVERSGDETVKLKMLQIILTLVQETSCKSNDYLANVLGICFRILSHSRNTDTVLNTAAATIRQVVAVVFDGVSIETEGKTANDAALMLIEDLCHLAGGSPAIWLQSPSVPRHFSLELLEFIITQKADLFRTSPDFESALRERICRVLQQLMNEAFDMDSEPAKNQAHKFAFKVMATLLNRFYALIPGKISQIWHPLCAGALSSHHRWRQIVCLQVLKTCVSDHAELYYLYENYDVAQDFDILAVSRVVDVTVELLRPKKRSMGGDEDRKSSLEDRASTPSSSAAEDASDEATVSVLALETLLKITNGIHMLSQECTEGTSTQNNEGFKKHVCVSMLDRFADSFFSAFKICLRTGICSENVVLSILKGYQDVLQSAAAFELTAVTKKFLVSLCQLSLPSSQGSGQDTQALSPLNVHAVRTLLNVVHQLGNVLGSSWLSVVTTLHALDGILSRSVGNKDLRNFDFGMESDLEILETSLKHLFDGTSNLCTEAVVCLLSSLRDVSLQSITAQPNKQQNPSFCFDHMVAVLLKNLDRVQDLWGVFLSHVIEVISINEPTSWTIAIDALDRAVVGILEERLKESNDGALENMLLVALESLFRDSNQQYIRIGILRIILNILRHSGDDLSRGWDPMLRLLKSVPSIPDPEIINSAFDSVELLVNEHLDQLPDNVQSKCLRTVAAFAKQATVMNVSLSSINLLWSAVDMFGKGTKAATPLARQSSYPGTVVRKSLPIEDAAKTGSHTNLSYLINVLQELSLDKRPEVRNSGIRSFFSAMVSYGAKFGVEEWEQCLAEVMLPLLKSVYYISMTSSSDETEGVELGKEKGRSVMMLMHYSRNSERKQWEETMVLALNGLCKILRLYLPILLDLKAFPQAWEQMTVICHSSLSQGTKDTAMAAIALIVQVSETFGLHCSSSPTETITSILQSTDKSIEAMTQKGSATPAVVRYEVVKAISQIAKSTRKVLSQSAIPMFVRWLQQLASKPFNDEEAAQNIPDMLPIAQKEMTAVIAAFPESSEDHTWIKVVHALCSFLYPEGLKFDEALSDPPPFVESDIASVANSLLWMNHIVEQLEKIYLQSVSPDIQDALFPTLISSLTRSMTSKFFPVEEGQPPLWIKAGSLFKSVLESKISQITGQERNDPQWQRNWEVIANCFETIFSGQHVISDSDLISSPEASELKITVLDTLAETIMSASDRMSDGTLRRLIALTDTTISIHSDSSEYSSPAGNLCQSCLRKLFVLCSHSNAFPVAIIALPLFISRCKKILSIFSSAESGSTHLSLVKVGEAVFALEMLSSLRVSTTVAEAVLSDSAIYQRLASGRGTSLRRPSGSWLAGMRRPHLLMIYDTLCDCVMSKEPNVRALVSELLKSVGHDIGMM